jgi:hypothetical protein
MHAGFGREFNYSISHAGRVVVRGKGNRLHYVAA